jgi:hypothetical protein
MYAKMALDEGSLHEISGESNMSDEELLTWTQAAQIYTDAGVSISTFQRRIGKTIIKQGDGYPKRQVLAALSKEKNVKKAPRKIATGATDWVQEDDLLSLLKLDRERYGEYTVDISVTQHWWRKNPRMCRILFDQNNRRDIWGAITIMPMEEETIFKLLRGDLNERDITADDILTFEEGGTYNGYVASAVMSPHHSESLIVLLNSVFNYWCKIYPRIKWRRLYAFASSPEGEDMIKKLIFSARYDLGEDAYELDPYRRNPSPLVKRFQRCIGLEDSRLNLKNPKEGIS